MDKIEVFNLPENGRERCDALIKAFVYAPPDTEVTIAFGKVGQDVATATHPAVLIRISGTVHGFTAAESIFVAEIFEDTRKKFPTWAETESFDAFAMAIREAARMARALAMN